MVVVGLPAVPLPGKGLTRPRPSSRDMRLPEVFPTMVRFLHRRRPPLLRPGAAEGPAPRAGPASAGLVAGTGASRVGLLPAWPGLIRESWPAPQRPADSGSWVAASGLGCCTFLRTGRGLRGMGHSGTCRPPRSRVRVQTPTLTS